MQRLEVRSLLCEISDALVEEAERRFARSRLPYRGEFLLLAGADDGQVTDLGVRLLHHLTGHCHDAFSQRSGDGERISGIVVLYHDASGLYLDVYLEFRDFQFK